MTYIDSEIANVIVAATEALKALDDKLTEISPNHNLTIAPVVLHSSDDDDNPYAVITPVDGFWHAELLHADDRPAIVSALTALWGAR